MLECATPESAISKIKNANCLGADAYGLQIESLRITDLLKRELGAPFLFLSGGECSLHRRLGLKLGCCMSLCVYDHDELSYSAQPLLQTMKTVRDVIDF